MYREDKQIRDRHAVACAARRCALLGQHYTSQRARIYLRIAEDDPPDHPARPPCTICTLKNWWSTAPPQNMLPATAGKVRTGPRPVRRFAARGGDG